MYVCICGVLLTCIPSGLSGFYTLDPWVWPMCLITARAGCAGCSGKLGGNFLINCIYCYLRFKYAPGMIAFFQVIITKEKKEGCWPRTCRAQMRWEDAFVFCASYNINLWSHRKSSQEVKLSTQTQGISKMLNDIITNNLTNLISSRRMLFLKCTQVTLLEESLSPFTGVKVAILQWKNTLLQVKILHSKPYKVNK